MKQDKAHRNFLSACLNNGGSRREPALTPCPTRGSPIKFEPTYVGCYEPERIFRRAPGRIKSVDDMNAPKRGFTLVELLVVIASLAILAITLLPAFAGTRQNSQVIGCLANQRQLAAAWIMYAQDNRDVLVPNRGLNGANGVSYSGDPRNQVTLLPGGANADWCPGNMQNAQDVQPGPYPGGSKYSWWIQVGLLYPYINNINIYHCPADHSIVPRGGGAFTAPALRTYSMNCLVQPMDAPGNATTLWTPPSGGPVNGWAYYTKLSNMTRPGPGKTWVFIEESPYSIDDGFFAFDPRNTTEWFNSPAVLHGNASVLAFADGHSDAHRWTDQSMISAKPATPGGNVDNWPADPNSGDLAWFISASTAPQ
jgi:prepilin-type N-terminal cleavage/methylation domain-containing protein